jgi:hypothetical protein
MNKGLMSAAAAALLLVSFGSFAEDDIEARCNQWAQEDKVPADEMQDYMAQCIEDQRDSGAVDSSSDQPSDQSPDQPSD